MGFDSLRDTLRETYYTTEDDVIKDFFEPVMSRSSLYDRGAGYFSSSVLVLLSKGFKRLIGNNGRIRVITSPYLTEDDIKAIREGYDKRKTRDIIERVILRDLSEPRDKEERWHLGFLSWLIENNYLDIKIAFMEGDKGHLYHEKIGIFTDGEGRKIAFAGSSNETAPGILYNYERLDVYPYWNYATKIKDMEQHFDKIWNDKANSLQVIEFPKVAIEKLHKCLPDYLDDREKYAPSPLSIDPPRTRTPKPTTPARENDGPSLPDRDLRPYQKEAIENWAGHGFRGIFDMATGTGKTYTALGALVRLYNHCGKNLAVVICCPFRHLVEQWVEDLRVFNIDPIIGYSDSKDRHWRENLPKYVDLHNTIGRFFCFITTNRTFSSVFVQQEVSRLNHKSLLIADEAHYTGSPTLSIKLPQNFDFRLALSATIERFGDKEGTMAIYDYFGDKCISYSLDRAIQAGFLSRYNYYPIIVYLTEGELSEYKGLTQQYTRIAHFNEDGQLSDKAKYILLKRSKIIAGAQDKVPRLKEVMTINRYNKKDHILVYCGTASVDEEDEDKPDEGTGARQIDTVCRMMGNELNMVVSSFTSKESMKDRRSIREDFSTSYIQALAAIKCLDEGFNIPEIRTAFILASTTNPKEFIQRLGRVLRTAPGKDIAEIYDFVTLPRPVDQARTLSEQEQIYEQGLVKREFIRMCYYNDQASNKIENEHDVMLDLERAYNLYEFHDLNKSIDWDGLD